MTNDDHLISFMEGTNRHKLCHSQIVTLHKTEVLVHDWIPFPLSKTWNGFQDWNMVVGSKSLPMVHINPRRYVGYSFSLHAKNNMVISIRVYLSRSLCGKMCFNENLANCLTIKRKFVIGTLLLPKVVSVVGIQLQQRYIVATR